MEDGNDLEPENWLERIMFAFASKPVIAVIAVLAATLLALTLSLSLSQDICPKGNLTTTTGEDS